MRSVAETTPTESDWSSPKGLPIAATGSPDRTNVGGRDSCDRVQVEAVRVHLDQGDVGVGVEADDARPATWLRSANST